MRPGVLVGISFAFVAIWFVLFSACSPPPLPAEGPFTETVASNRDR